MRNYLKTTKRLTVALANAYRIDGMEAYLADYWLSSLDLDAPVSGDYRPLPYWVEVASLRNVRQGTEIDDYLSEVVEGYHDSKYCKSALHNGSIVTVGGSRYEYIDAVALPAEVELQAEDGGFCHYYNGSGFLRIWQRID